MNSLTKIGLPLLILFSSFVAADENADEFFQRYIDLGEKFDVNVASMYSDAAKIHTYRVYPHGLERTMELTGTQWKQLIVKVMPLAKAKNDKSTFSNIKISKYGTGYKIRADRYSDRKCYTDKGYYMVIEPDANKSFHVIEEYIETQPQSNC